jgi:hypothetical protein
VKNSFALGLITPEPLTLQVPRDWRSETRNAHGARFNADGDEGGNSSRDADFTVLVLPAIGLAYLQGRRSARNWHIKR